LLLNQLFSPKKLFEGGNLELPNPEDPNTPYQADEIDLKVHNRAFMVGLLDKLLHDINIAFYKRYKKPIWNPELLQSKQFLGGSSLHFFNTAGISDKEFAKYKPKVGDIDTQCNKELEPEIEEFLTTYDHKQIGDTTLLGFSRGSEQLNALFQFQDPPIKIQIDFEFGQYDTETDSPDEWYRFSHSSEWNDVQAGIKGVFHKWLYRALTSAHSSVKHQVDVKKTKTNIKPNVKDNDLSFAVASGQGGGLSQKYEPYIHTDPETGEKITHKDEVPYKRLVPSAERTYIQKLDQQFYYFFGAKPEGNDSELQKSFLGTLELINKYIPDQSAKEQVFMAFLNLCFEPGVGQMITKNDPGRDQQVKFAAIDNFIKICKLNNLRKTAVDMGKAYVEEFNEVQAYKKEHPEEKQPRAALKRMKAAQGQNLDETQVKAQLRKGMPHLHDLKSADLLDLLDEIHDGNGNFKLQNIPLNVKVDGFGGRFGKNSEGKPFMGTSRTEPRYQAGFLDYHQKKGTTDPEILGRAQLFDNLFTEMMNAVKLVDSKLGPDFLVDKQVTCEVLYLPFATETPEGKLKFVGIHYDKLPEGVQLALVPFRVTDATTGEDLPDANEIVKSLTGVGRAGSVMFIDNSLTQDEALDVTALVPPLENIEQMKAMLASKKRDQAAEVKAALQPVAMALEKAIIEDPNIIGKDMLGQDYEGIVINSRLGPIKVTSQEQRDVITAKNAAKVNARTERPRGEAKTAVVAIGSFIGHKGHEELLDYTIKKAQALGGDPYLFIGNAEGKDDPIPPAVKVQTWHKLYPELANNISTVQDGGQLIQKIKHELINPLPGKPPRYDNIVIMVGEDRAGMNMPTALMKAVNKFQGYEHVKVSLEVTPRGTGISGTALRNSLKNDPPEKSLAVWSNAFDVNKLGVDWIKNLMDITRKGMGIQQQPQQQPAPIAERLFNALIRPQLNESTNIDEDWQKANKRDKTDGMSQKAVNSYRRENPGSKLKTAVTTKPSKLKKGSKASKRRKSFCARMSGNKGPMKKPNGKPTPKALALRRWNCESVEEMQQLIMLAEQEIHNLKQGMMEATGDKRFDAMMGQIQREPTIPDAQMPPTDVKDLYAWAVKNNKPYHKIFAEWANREGYKSVAPALQKAGDLDSDALDYWTPEVWKIWYGPDSEMPQGWSKERVPDELRDYLETVFDAYDRIVFDWPTEYRQIGKQGVAEAGSPAQRAAIAISKKEKQTDEDQRLDPKCWKGYRKAGTKMKGGTRVNNCVPVREDVEDLMAGYIKLLGNK